jgi:RNA polymerase sigma factor (TIGR02999 family)
MDSESLGGDVSITVLLRKWRDGDRGALEQLMPLVYPRLRAIAGGLLRAEAGEHTLQATALVNEVYLRLARQRKVEWSDRGHFYSFSARVMRQILVDHARSQNTAKRGGTAARLPLHDEIPWVDMNGLEVIELNRALDALEAIDSRKVRLVELRYFLGCMGLRWPNRGGMHDRTLASD